jgi:hypothetical protein
MFESPTQQNNLNIRAEGSQQNAELMTLSHHPISKPKV